MKNLMDDLLALQDLEFQTGQRSQEQEQRIQSLRERLPNPVLRRYDRLLARRKKGVAMVRHGVCGECHIKVAIGTLGALAFGTDIQVCGNCGRYLYLVEDKPIAAPVLPSKTRAAKAKKEAPAHVS
jgi:predicted  nucleic acid-binding Zn-ribbon protein